MIRFKAETPAEKPAATAAAKPEKRVTKAKAAKPAPKGDLLDLAAENADEKD